MSSHILHLHVFQEGKPSVFRSDALDIGIEAILLQDVEGKVKLPIAYASKTFWQGNATAIENECLAIVCTVKTFRKYLFGVELMLECDQKLLSFCRLPNP